MNYIQIYENLMEKARLRPKPEGYVEKHHAIPKCLGGDNSKQNLRYLTAKEHFVAHHLLTRIHPHNNKLTFAFRAMFGDPKNKRKINITASQFEEMRKACATSQLGSKNHQFGKPSAFRGKKHTAETKAKISETCKKNKLTEEQLDKLKYAMQQPRGPMSDIQKNAISISKRGKPNHKLRGRDFTEEHKRNLSAAHTGKTFSDEVNAKKASQKVTCLVCKQVTNVVSLTRFHKH